MKSLYETDLHAWAVQNAELVRERRLEDVDWDHIAEELDIMAGRERRELKSRLIVLVSHLLKYQARSDAPSRSWWLTIRDQRWELESVLEDNPSLRPQLAETLQGIYGKARQKAADEMLMDIITFPAECPFTIEQILDTDYFPTPTVPE